MTEAQVLQVTEAARRRAGRPAGLHWSDQWARRYEQLVIRRAIRRDRVETMPQ